MSDAIKTLNVKFGTLDIVPDAPFGAEAQNIDVSYDANNHIIEDINVPGVVVNRTEGLPATLKNFKDETVSWDQMEVLGSKNLMPSGVTPDEPINGITYTVAEDGSITLTGNASGISSFEIELPKALNDTYLYTIDCPTLSTLGSGVSILLKNAADTDIALFGPTGESDGSKEILISANSGIKKLHIRVEDLTQLQNFVIKPMIRLASITDRTYVPYAQTNRDLTLKISNLDDMVGATSTQAGIHGLVPAPAAGDQDKVLKGDGTWGEKMNLDGKNAADEVNFPNAFTIGTRAEDSVIGEKSVAIGDNNSVIGDYSVAIGENNTIITDFSMAKGKNNIIGYSEYLFDKYSRTLPELPYVFSKGSAVVIGNEIHILGSSFTNNKKKHYKLNVGNISSNWNEVSTLPYDFYGGSAVVIGNEIHILGGGNIFAQRSHYKLDITNVSAGWSEVSTLPYTFNYGSAVVIGNEIHILGSNVVDDIKKHYKLDITNVSAGWSEVSTLPYELYNGSAVAIGKEIHILGSNYNGNFKKHYKLDTTNVSAGWNEVSTLPYTFYNGSVVVVGSEIHILGGSESPRQHYKLDTTNVSAGWSRVSTLPYDFYNNSAVIVGNGIHILGSPVESYVIKHLKLDITNISNGWTSIFISLPYNFHNSSAVTIGNDIHILGSENSNDYRKHYKLNTTNISIGWNEVSTLPYDLYEGSAVVIGNEIHILGSSYSSGISNNYRKHYKLDTTNVSAGWNEVSTLPYDFYGGSAITIGNEIHILGGGNSTTCGNHYKLDTTNISAGWSEVSTLPYEFKNGSAVVIGNEIHILGSSYNGNYRKHYKLDITNVSIGWSNVSTLPYTFSYGSAAVIGNEIHILGSYISSNYRKHYKLDITNVSIGWSNVSTLLYDFSNGSAVAIGNEIYIIQSSNASYTFYSIFFILGTSGTNSQTYGDNLEAYKDNQFVIGENNAPNLKDIFIVGNGTSAQRSNALALDNKGSLYLLGSQYIIRGIKKGTTTIQYYTLEEGANYMLHCNIASSTTKGGKSLYIAAPFNPSGTGITSSSLALPTTQNFGGAGASAAISTCTSAVPYVNSAGTTCYHPGIGIGSSSTAYTLRYSLVKILGSVDDFGEDDL